MIYTNGVEIPSIVSKDMYIKFDLGEGEYYIEFNLKKGEYLTEVNNEDFICLLIIKIYSRLPNLEGTYGQSVESKAIGVYGTYRENYINSVGFYMIVENN